MMHTITSIVFIIVAAALGFGLTAVVVLTIANAKVARQGREKPEPPPQSPDSAAFKRGA